MLNGSMSPSRNWFALETSDLEMMEFKPVREWLWVVERILRAILNESNFYNMAPVLLKELLLYGTGCMSHVSDFEDVARFYTHTAGSYYIAQNDRLDIDTLVRKFERPVVQVVKQFGYDKVSKTVQTMYDNGNYESWVKMVHFVEPNDNYSGDSPLSVNKPYLSVYYEPEARGSDKENVLSIGGFNQFPAYVPRWDVTEGDIYGTNCPGMTALGDIKQLQVEEKRKAQGIDKMVNPPLSGPPSVKNVPVSGLPGGLTIYDGNDQQQKLAPIYQVEPRIQELRLDMDAVEKRIEEAFFVDLFFAISQMEGIQPRNELDLTQRNEERLVQLGPVLERLHGELLTSLINRLFDQAMEAGIIPPPPEEIANTDLNIRFISTLAMAQRAVVTSDLERLVAFTGNLAQAGWPQAVQKLDADQIVDEYARATGTPPKVVASDEVVKAEREAQAQQQQAAQALELAQQGADVAKTAGEVDQEQIGDLVNGIAGDGGAGI
jgi:hypothetical protein